jgi:hypothetical protein
LFKALPGRSPFLTLHHFEWVTLLFWISRQVQGGRHPLGVGHRAGPYPAGAAIDRPGSLFQTPREVRLAAEGDLSSIPI